MKAFLSYARPDREIARVIADGLRTAGHNVWFDEIELTAGAGWGREIEEALNDSRAMIVLVSPASMDSKEVRREIEHAFLARNFAHRVLPVYVKPTRDVPWFLGTLQAVRAGSDPAEAIQQIKDALDHFDQQSKQPVQGNA
jgi:hypothetical protein